MCRIYMKKINTVVRYERRAKLMDSVSITICQERESHCEC